MPSPLDEAGHRADGPACSAVNSASEAADDKAEIARLTALSRIDYDRERKAAAEAFRNPVMTLRPA